MAGTFVSGKGIGGDSKIKSINRKNASEFKIVLTENAKEADFVFTLISKKENVTFTFEQEYVKDEGWDRPPIEITEKEALANKQRFDEDVAKKSD